MTVAVSTGFRDEFDFAARKAEASRITIKYNDRIPVICERPARDQTIDALDKKKYLVPKDLTVGQFIYVIRKRIKIAPEKAIFLFVDGGVLPVISETISNVYAQHKNEDGFLYMTYSGENAFGAVTADLFDNVEADLEGY